MKKRIIVRRFGIIHFHANCDECNFGVAIHTKETPTTKDVRNAVIKHVRKTGHRVWIESGSHTDYELDDGAK